MGDGVIKGAVRRAPRTAAIPRGGGRGRIAVLVPCYNEAAAVARVVGDFQAALPGAVVYVYDNNSTDDTSRAARQAGAVTRPATFQGKGNVVRLMFSDVEADIYVLVDGDATYDAASAPAMVRALLAGRLDMVNGVRVAQQQEAYRAGHRFGNRLLTGLVRAIFGAGFRDMLSGYRVFSRRFVKSFPANSRGFEIETELTVHALRLRLPVCEIDTPYFARCDGSASKLNTLRDGVRILSMIGLLLKEEKPLQCFGAAALLLTLLALGFAAPVLLEYFSTGLVPRLPTLLVSVSFGMTALLSIACGLILDTVARGRLEQRRFAYLALAGPPTLED